jgi:hypothetical protein
VAINFVDVFKETRNNALSGLFIITFWLLSSTSYYEALSRQQLLQYLTAYLILNEAYQTQASCHNEESCRLYISFPWAGKPDDLYFKVVESHAPLAPNRVLRRTETLGNTNLPFSRFLLVAEQRDYYVATGITIALVVNRANKFEIENTWSLLRPWFAARGYSTTQLKDVNSTDPALTQLIRRLPKQSLNTLRLTRVQQLMYLVFLLQCFIFLSF